MIVPDLQQTDCPECGTFFGVPYRFLQERRKDKRLFYCPNGHSMSYKESESDKLRRERDLLKQREAMLQDEIAAERERAAKAEAANKRLKKRASAGTCPCCQRTFSNMATHMKRHHPQFVADGGANVVPLKNVRG